MIRLVFNRRVSQSLAQRRTEFFKWGIGLIKVIVTVVLFYSLHNQKSETERSSFFARVAYLPSLCLHMSSRPEFRRFSGTEWRDPLNLGSNSESLSPRDGMVCE